MTLGTILSEGTSKKVLGDLQVAWNKYKFNLDTKPSEAVKWQTKANKLWKSVQKIDPDARNSAGKLWKDVIAGDINAGGKTAKIVKVTEAKAKLVWKKLGDQYTVAYSDDLRQVLGMFMKYSKSFNDNSPSYEIEPINGIEFKKFPKVADAKKYVVAFIEGK